MKQYKICFYRNMQTEPAATYYREFENYKDAKEWAGDTLTSDSLYSRYTLIEISVKEFLANIPA